MSLSTQDSDDWNYICYPKWTISFCSALLVMAVAVPVCRALSLNDFTRGVVSRDGIYRFEVPGDWEPVAGLNKRATIQIGNPRTDEFMIGFSGEKSTLGESLEGALSKAVRELNRNSRVTKILSRQRFVSGGHRFCSEAFQTYVNGRPVLYYVATIGSASRIFQVVLWTKPGRQHVFNQRVPRILRTFLELREK